MHTIIYWRIIAFNRKTLPVNQPLFNSKGIKKMMSKNLKNNIFNTHGNITLNLLLIATCLAIWVVFITLTVASENVDFSEIGVLINNYSGDIEVHPLPGKYLYNAITSDFLTLDKTEQTIEMTANLRKGDKGISVIKALTRDSNDVKVSTTISYKLLLEPEAIERVISVL